MIYPLASTERTGLPTIQCAFELVEKALACDSLEGLLITMIGELKSLLDADSACAFELTHDGEMLRIGRSVANDMPSRILSAYSGHFVQFDPICASMFQKNGGFTQDCRDARVLRLSDKYNVERSDHRTYLNDFLVKERLNHVLGLSLRSEIKDSPLLIIGLQRSGGTTDFSRPELCLAEQISNVLMSRFEHFCLQQAYESMLSQLETSDSLICYDITIDKDDQLCTHSVADAGRFRVYDSRKSVIFHPGVKGYLDSLVQSGAISERRLSLLRGVGIAGIPSDYCVRVTLELVGPTTSVYRIEARPPAKSDSVGVWAAAQGLTSRELDIILKLAAGLRNQQISQELDISIRTVENHLRSIFQKVGVTSRLQVISRLSAIIPAGCLVPALDGSDWA